MTVTPQPWREETEGLEHDSEEKRNVRRKHQRPRATKKRKQRTAAPPRGKKEKRKMRRRMRTQPQTARDNV